MWRSISAVFHAAALLAASAWLAWQLSIFGGAFDTVFPAHTSDLKSDRAGSADAGQSPPELPSSVSPQPNPAFSVTLLAIGREAELVFQSVPFTALDAAVVFTNLQAFGDSPAGFFDPPLGEDGDTPQQQVLGRALDGKGAVVGCVLDSASVQPLSDAQVAYLPALEHVSGDLSSVQQFNGLARYPDSAVSAQTRVGFTQIDFAEQPQLDGDIIRLPLIARAGDRVIPSFLLQAAARSAGVEPHLIFVEVGAYIHLGNRLAIPIDERGWTDVPWRVWRPLITVQAAESIVPTDPEGLHSLRYIPGLFQALTADFILIGPHDPREGEVEQQRASPEVQAAALLGLLEGAASRPAAEPAPNTPEQTPSTDEETEVRSTDSSGEQADPHAKSRVLHFGVPAPGVLSLIASCVLGLLLLARISPVASGFWLIACAAAAAGTVAVLLFTQFRPVPSPALFAATFIAGGLLMIRARNLAKYTERYPPPPRESGAQPSEETSGNIRSRSRSSQTSEDAACPAAAGRPSRAKPSRRRRRKAGRSS